MGQTTLEKAIYNRTSLLVGDRVMEVLSSKRVIIFGVGGVGSWCAEGLVRSGVTQLTLVDSDRVCITNVNRQEMATTKTIGQVKVEALKARLLEINPKAQIEAVQDIYSEETAENFHLGSYDYIVDAIDSLKDKASLILRACETQATFFSAMGAALKMDPTQVRVAEFWEVRGCPLGAALRKKLRKNKTLPAKKFLCVYDEEVLTNLGKAATCGTSACLCPKADGGPGREDLLNHEWCSSKAVINGTTAHITGIFGFTLSGLIIKDIYRKALSID
ncbi:MAG: tRNA threonylcarbamoyladenosine dehydratase [Bacteroidales bacterium]|nr:tRNA threonylcarbamoyladenosine dehydratase [Bacteroidales bacterium]